MYRNLKVDTEGGIIFNSEKALRSARLLGGRYRAIRMGRVGALVTIRQAH